MCLVPAILYIDAVTALGNLSKEQKSKMASPYAVIHNELKKKIPR